MEYQKPEYSMTFDDDQGQVKTADNADLNALTKKVLNMMNPSPVIEDQPDTFVKLPGGLIKDGELYQDAEVQELTGEHEERLAKARVSNNPVKFIDTLIQCGTVSIGQTKATPEVLNSMLQGDLDTLILGIRRATFGDEFDIYNIECPECGESNDLHMNLSDIPLNEMDDPSVREFEVALRKNRKAKVVLPTGALQNELFKKTLTIPEMNSITLAHCVIAFIEADGSEKPCNGLADVKKLGVSDRKVLQDFLFEKQPGPRYDKVTASCHACEGEVFVPLSVGLLFRGI